MAELDPAAASDLLVSLRWSADRLITNHLGERWWLKQIADGITECCPWDAPCSRHETPSEGETGGRETP